MRTVPSRINLTPGRAEVVRTTASIEFRRLPCVVPVPHSRRRIAAIQRALGMEFQTGVRLFAPDLYDGVDIFQENDEALWNIVADDVSADGESGDLEFVTDQLETLEQVEEALDGIVGVAEKLQSKVSPSPMNNGFFQLSEICTGDLSKRTPLSELECLPMTKRGTTVAD